MASLTQKELEVLCYGRGFSAVVSTHAPGIFPKKQVPVLKSSGDQAPLPRPPYARWHTQRNVAGRCSVTLNRRLSKIPLLPPSKLSAVTDYSIAKEPSFPNVTVTQLETIHAAVDFIPAFTLFIKEYFPRCGITPNRHDRFAVCKQLSIRMPRNRYIADKLCTCRIRATPPALAKARSPGTPVHFDMALVVKDPAHYSPSSGVQCLRVAQIRAIFMLQPQYGEYPHPLAYVEWFTSLQTGQRKPLLPLYERLSAW
ncbi:hypothetical protein B0H14DRAFT_3148267 [Mycena olivaceomarginata]|nr:hypothetical protein B0H14DRAFT_3148267 [Mycena olivaceomarginata]